MEYTSPSRRKLKHQKSNAMDERFQFGDIIATRSDKFLSRAIRYFMRKYRPDAPNFSHIAVVINLWGEQWIAEALAWGVRIWSLEQSGYSKKKQVVILRYRKPMSMEFLSETQVQAMSKKMVSLAGTRYQYENLPQWAIKIWTKLNIFKRSNEKAIYCSELGAIALNAAIPGTFVNPNMVSPADHFIRGIYDIHDINGVL